MSYTDCYKKYLEEAKKDILRYKETNGHIVFGYTSNVDVLLHYDENIINEIINSSLDKVPNIQGGAVIDSIKSLGKFISYFMLNGMGGEADITDFKVVEYLLGKFKYTLSPGGTAAQGAAALARIGIPLLVHVSDSSKEFCDMIGDFGLSTIAGGKIVPLKDTASGETVYHFVLSFSKGDRLRIGNTDYEVPTSNRVILDYDTKHKDIDVREDFKKYIEENASNIISYNISGFNAVTDLELLKKRLKELVAHYCRVKEKNADCIIYFESAHYLSAEVKKAVFSKIAPFINIMGMNEEELVVHMKEQNILIDNLELSDLIRSMDLLINKYGVNGIIIHTKDYAMYYGEEIAGVDMEKALTLGNLLSGTKARVGHYGTLKDCEETLKKVSLSEQGLRFARELETYKLKKKAVVVPSRYMEKPVCTIGLGDTFVAGVQFAFIK